MLVDSHCHLNMPQPSLLDEIVSRALKNGVEYMQTICTKKSDIVDIVEIIGKYERIFGSIGIHPDEVSQDEFLTAEEIVKYINSHSKIIGIGETGLDFFREYDFALQRKSFLEHIKAGQLSGLPVIIHSRNSDLEVVRILKDELSNAPLKSLIHCFTGDRDFLRNVLDCGCYVSISGIVTFNNAKVLQDVVRYVPLDRILVETDSPYLAPVPYRGRVNEPSFVSQVAEKLAQLFDVSFEDMCNITSNNFFTLFSRANGLKIQG
jgi:TatD DNase family protein